MPVGQPVLDTNYKHLKIIRTWQKTTMIKTIITTARKRESLNFYCILATGPNSKLKVIIKHIIYINENDIYI